ncbi:MAG: polysaccharide deacetylase family protein [Planctomycetota bacterium]
MQKIRILTYHRVGLPRQGRYEKFTVLPNRFALQMRTLARLGFGFVSMDYALECLQGAGDSAGSANAALLKKRSPVVVTFDDGYGDLMEHALPLLKALKIPAMIYIVAAQASDQWVDWGERGPLQLLSWPDLKAMVAEGMTPGSHTLTHPHLMQISRNQLRAEVIDSKKIIEDRLGVQVRHFCYPFGEFDERVEETVREAGYLTACTTQRGVAQKGVHPLRLPRLSVGKRMGWFRFMVRILIRNKSRAAR